MPPYILKILKAELISTKVFDTQIAKFLNEDERAALEYHLASDPLAHPVIPGLNGIRKARWGRMSSGKRGGIRVIYFFVVSEEVVWLLAAYAKNEKENIDSGDKKILKRIVEEITAT